MSKKFCDFLINILLVKNCQLGFSSKIKVPQLGLTRLGTFTARARSSRKIPARTHLYYPSIKEKSVCIIPAAHFTYIQCT